MRAYKLIAAAAGLCLATGCAQDGKDGKDGVDGAKGDKGDKGDPGAPGTDGVNGQDGQNGVDGQNGENGADAPCAAFEPLAVSDVVGLDAPVFPGQPVPFDFEFAGGSESVSVQFIGTMRLLDGTATIPPLPTSGTVAGSFTVTSPAEGDISYVVVATDGCTVATTTVQVRVRAALVSIINLDPNLGDIGFKVRGETQPLYQVVQTIFGPFAVATASPGSGFYNYFRVAQSDWDLDMHPDADLDGLPDLDSPGVQLPKIALQPDGRVIVVAYVKADGADAFAVLHPDHSLVAEVGASRFQFANLANGIASIDVSTNADMSSPLFAEAANGVLTPGQALGPLDYTAYLDVDGDATYDFEADLPFERSQVLPGDYVAIFAWVDGDGMLQVFNHTTGGNGTEFEGQMYFYPGTVLVNLGPPDASYASETATEVGDYGLQYIDFPVEAEAGCTIEALEVNYELNAVDPNWLSDVELTLIAPSGKEVLLGTGKTGGPGVETGRFQVFGDFDFEAANGTWSLVVDDTYNDGSASAVTLNSFSVGFYCKAPADVSVAVNPAPDLAIADNDPDGATSNAVVTDTCNVAAVLVDWNVTHAAATELTFNLRGPSGLDTTFHALGAPGDDAQASGTFGPLFDWNGTSAAGTWQLQVVDGVAGHLGTLDDWTLRVYCEE